jgi:5-methylcytosine-specific restriction endonuclease McrA
MDWTDEKIEELYLVVKYFSEKYLKPQGVRVPKLRNKDGQYVKDALTLIRLAEGYPDTKEVSKSELTAFIRRFYPSVNDCQQARHLGAQKGYKILSSRRREGALESRDSYKLVNLFETHEYFKSTRRKHNEGDWEGVLEFHGHMCTNCGSKEGHPERYNRLAITNLQKAHRNPHLPLTSNNMIPQCSHCNQKMKDHWVFDETGSPYAIANPKIILNSCEQVQKETLKLLLGRYGEQDNE